MLSIVLCGFCPSSAHPACLLSCTCACVCAPCPGRDCSPCQSVPYNLDADHNLSDPALPFLTAHQLRPSVCSVDPILLYHDSDHHLSSPSICPSVPSAPPVLFSFGPGRNLPVPPVLSVSLPVAQSHLAFVQIIFVDICDAGDTLCRRESFREE